VGSLKLPSSGRVYVDTQSVVYTVEPHPAYFSVLRPLWAAVGAGSVELVTSDLTLMECLVGPYKTGDVGVEARYERLFAAANVVTLHPADRAILRRAARLRASNPKLRTPDAIHAATALVAGVSLLVTNDPAFLHVPGLAVELLNDVIARP
jgi:predicted nucleic acid-binding protein